MKNSLSSNKHLNRAIQITSEDNDQEILGYRVTSFTDTTKLGQYKQINDKIKESRKEHEKQFFDKTFETESRRPVHKFYEIIQSSREYYENYLLANCINKDVIEYGCGRGSYVFLLAKHGARVIGIDISEVAIKMAKAQAEIEGIRNIEFLEQDAEAMKFKNNSVDMIVGTSILHHLHLEKAMKEIARVLKPEGKAIFIEPLGHNPVINLFRKLTPRFRTADEHPLTNKNLKLIKQFYHQTNYTFFHFLSLLAVPFRNTQKFYSLLKTLDNLDQQLFKWLPPLRMMAWQVVIILEKPKKL